MPRRTLVCAETPKLWLPVRNHRPTLAARLMSWVNRYGIGRFYRDARLFRIDAGTTRIQQRVIARNMLHEARGG